MAYELKWTRRAKQSLAPLQKDIIRRIVEKVNNTVETPFHFFDRMTGTELWKLRVGDYRVLAEMKGDIIYIVEVGHRRNVYKRGKLQFLNTVKEDFRLKL